MRHNKFTISLSFLNLDNSRVQRHLRADPWILNCKPSDRFVKTLVEDHSLGDVEENSPLRHPLDRGSQHLALHVRALLHQVLGAHAVIDPRNPLLDNRALVQVGRHEVRRGPDDLNAAVVRLVVGLGALERGQEAVVDVDDLAAHGGAQRGREDLHVAGQDDELDVVLPDQLQDLALLRGLGVLGDGQVVELDAVAPGQRLKVRVVRDDDGDVDAELARLGAEEQVVEAVADLGDHDQDAHLAGDRPDVVVHLQVGGQGLKGGLEGLGGGDGAEVHAHEELVGDGVGKLLQLHHVDALASEDARHSVHNTRLVRAGQGEDVILALGGCHGRICMWLVLKSGAGKIVQGYLP